MMQAAVQGVRKLQLYSITDHVYAYIRTISRWKSLLYAWTNLQLAEHVYIILENPVYRVWNILFQIKNWFSFRS